MPREPTFEEIVAGDDPVAQASIEVIEAFTADRQRLGRVRAAATEAPRAARLPLRFDLLELDGKDLRCEPIEVRKATLASLLRSCAPGVRLNQHLTHDGISIPRTEAHVIRHLHERMSYGLFVPDVVLE